jgi:hypothetical protein
MYCPHCGAKRVDEGIFCGACGSKFIINENIISEIHSEIMEVEDNFLTSGTDVEGSFSEENKIDTDDPGESEIVQEEAFTIEDKPVKNKTDDVEDSEIVEEGDLSVEDEKLNNKLREKDSPDSDIVDETLSTWNDGYSSIQSPDEAAKEKTGINKKILLALSAFLIIGLAYNLLPNESFLNDDDRDGDGVSDSEDAFPDNYNEQYDSDYDGVGNNGDNCPYTGNINQRDTDADGQGDDCDSDDDGDGVSDYYDDCPLGTKYGTDTDGDGCKNTEDSDDDGDGLEDWNDDCPSGEANWYSTSTTDFDGDGCQDSSEDSDDDNDGYSDYQDWYDRGDGGIKLELTRFTAWSGGYYDGDDSNPDVYAYIGIDTTCSDGDPDWYYYEYSVHSNSYDLSDWLETNWNIAETATTICIIIEIWDDDSFDDDKLDYVEGSGTAYYYTFDLDEGDGVLSREFDNRGENDVSILLHFEFSRVYYT